MRAALKRLLIGLAALAIAIAGTVWLIAHDDVARLRSIAAQAAHPLPPTLVHAIMAAEDPHILRQPRFSVRGLLPRGERTVSCGPSPLAYLLVRHDELTPRRRPLWRHAEAAVTSTVVAYSFTPDELLRIYAHEVYLGTRNEREIRGVEAASRVYFGKAPNQLTTAEAAMIAAMIRLPNVYSPARHPARALERRNKVLERMSQLHFIDEPELEAAISEPLKPRPLF